MSSGDRNIFQDEKAVTVIFGTLLLILVTIAVVSAFAYMASLTAKANMDRQSMIEAQKNENLKIVTIKPSPCYDPSYWDSDPSYWDNISFTVLNLDILDARIAAISINGNYLMNYFLLDENRNPSFIVNTNYPVLYNSSNKVEIPAGDASQIYFGNIYTHENITAASTVNLTNCPGRAYSGGYQRGAIIRDSANNTFTESASNFTLDDNTSILTINSSSITGSCTVEYRTMPDLTMQVSKGDPITVEIISDRINVFSKRFMPPEPIADVQIKPGAAVSVNYLLLDASNSNAPDGFITSYRWYVNKSNSTYPPDQLNGIKVRTNDLNSMDYPVNIDLEVTNNYGMFSRLSDPGRAGNITVT